MELIETFKVYKKYSDYVVQQSRSNLTKGNKNVSKELYNSIKSEVKISSQRAVISFFMLEYGNYQDKGVQGKSSSAKAPNSPYRFGSGKGKKGGLTNAILPWVKARGIQFKDRESGKFLSYKSTAFLITRSIYHKGIKETRFFSKPYEDGYKKYITEEADEALSVDVDRYIKNIKLWKK